MCTKRPVGLGSSSTLLQHNRVHLLKPYCSSSRWRRLAVAIGLRSIVHSHNDQPKQRGNLQVRSAEVDCAGSTSFEPACTCFRPNQSALLSSLHPFSKIALPQPIKHRFCCKCRGLQVQLATTHTTLLQQHLNTPTIHSLWETPSRHQLWAKQLANR